MGKTRITHMIRTGQEADREALMLLWKLCFPQDTERFVRFYFDRVYAPGQTLVMTGGGEPGADGGSGADGRPVAALQMIPYRLKMGGATGGSMGSSIVWGGYISGAMTHPDHRRRGYMAQLLAAAFDRMRELGYACTFLIPQEAHLIGYYGKFGFAKAFDEHSVRWRCQATSAGAEDKPASACDARVVRSVGGRVSERLRSTGRSPGREERSPNRPPSTHTAISTVDLPALYTAYSRYLVAKTNVVLKSEAQFANILWDLFDQQGVLFISDGGMAFAIADSLADGSEVTLTEFLYRDEEARIGLLQTVCAHFPSAETIAHNDPSAPITSYKGMIKSLDNSMPPPPDTHLGQMLE